MCVRAPVSVCARITHACMGLGMHSSMCAHVCLCLYTHIHAYMYTHVRYVYTWLRIHVCVRVYGVGGRGGAMWRLEDFVVLPWHRLCSLEIDSEMDHWVQKLPGEQSQEIHV